MSALNWKNYWWIGAFGLVILCYGLTIAISIDLHKTEVAKVDDANQKLEEEKKANRKNAATIARLNAALKEMEEEKRAVEEAAAIDAKSLRAAGEAFAQKAIDLEAKVAALEAARVPVTTPAASRTTAQLAPAAQGYSPTYQNTGSTTARNPFWNTVDGIRIAKGIRQAAETKWGSDFSMVKWEVEKQSEAYEQLLAYRKSYNKALKLIIDNATQKWGNEYSMVVWEIKKQAEAKNSLDRR